MRAYEYLNYEHDIKIKVNSLTKLEEKIYTDCQGKCGCCMYDGGCKVQKKLNKNKD